MSATKSKKELVMGFYSQGQTPEQILTSMNGISVYTTLASIKWWINDHLKGSPDRKAKTAESVQVIKNRQSIADTIQINYEEYDLLKRLHNFPDDHPVLWFVEPAKIFKKDWELEMLRKLSGKGAVLFNDKGLVKITQAGQEKLYFPSEELRQIINSHKTTNPEMATKKDAAAPAKKSATVAPAKAAASKAVAPAAATKEKAPVKEVKVKGPTKKDLVAKFMKEKTGEGKEKRNLNAAEILAKMGELNPPVTSTLASVRWYMADINGAAAV